MEKKVLVQFTKNKEETGLKNILSYIYKNKKNKIEVVFNTNEGIKSIEMGWISNTKSYYYILPQSVSKENKRKMIVETSQGDLLPGLTATLLRLGFKDSGLETKNDKRVSIKEIMNKDKLNLEGTDDLENIDFDNLKRKKTKENYKLGTIELLHLIFNKNDNKKVYWPNDITYKKIGKEKELLLDPSIKKVHKFKKKMGSVIVDYPLEELVDFTISSSSFNISAKGLQFIVLELHNGEYIETKQFRNKTIVENGVTRVGYLLAELTKENFLKLKKEGIIKKNEIYNMSKVYEIHLKGEKETIEFINPIIKKIPKEEIIDLVWDIESLKIKQTIYGRVIKELKAKINVFETVISDEDTLKYSELGINKNGVFEPETKDKEKENNETTEVKIETKIAMTIVKFPKTEVTKKETELLNSLVDVNKDIKTLIPMLEKVQKGLDNIKNELKEKRYKLNLIKYTFFLNGFDSSLDYDKDDKGQYINTKESKAANSVAPKEFVLLSNKDGSRTLKVEKSFERKVK